MILKIGSSTGTYTLKNVLGGVRHGTSTNSTPPADETVLLTSSTLFSWLQTSTGQVIRYPRTSTALILNDWGEIERRV